MVPVKGRSRTFGNGAYGARTGYRQPREHPWFWRLRSAVAESNFWLNRDQSARQPSCNFAMQCNTRLCVRRRPRLYPFVLAFIVYYRDGLSYLAVVISAIVVLAVAEPIVDVTAHFALLCLEAAPAPELIIER